MRLIQAAEGWELPTIDANCLKAQALLRIAAERFEEETGYSSLADCGVELPILVDEQQTLTGWTAIKEHFVNKNVIDRHLTAREKLENDAVAALVEHKFHNALLYSMWVEEDSYRQKTRFAYSHIFPFPLNLSLPWLKRREMRGRVGHLTKDKALSEAKECLRHLSLRLAQSEFFGGEAPSSLDAVVFGHLAVGFYSNLPAASITPLIAQHENLVVFLTRMMLRYFSSSPVPERPSLASPVEEPVVPTAPKMTEKEKEEWKRTKEFLGLAALLTTFFVLSSRHVDLDSMFDVPE